MKPPRSLLSILILLVSLTGGAEELDGRGWWAKLAEWSQVPPQSPPVRAPRAPQGPKRAATVQGVDKAPWQTLGPIRIEGWIIPNEMEEGEIATFLLSRVPAGCIHVPLPPPSSMVFVRMVPGSKRLKDVTTTLPIQVKGKLIKGGRVDSEFEIEAESVEILPHP